MEPFEKDDLTDQELDALLPVWNVPEMPATLKARIFPNPWWRRIWGASIRVPVPIACAVAALLAAAATRSLLPSRAPQPAVRSESAHPVAAIVWHPVKELRPRIIRSGNE
jgi:hypothetical protein